MSYAERVAAQEEREDREREFMEATKPVGMIDDNHRYYWQGVGPMPSVTGILRLQDALMGGDGLTNWAARIAADYVLSSIGDSNRLENIRDEAIAQVGKAARIGSAVHGQISDDLLGLEQRTTPETLPFVYQFARFRLERRPTFIEVEQVVLSPEMGYGGRFDFIAEIDGRVALVDIKTGKLKASHRLQLAGYAAASFIGRPDDPTEYPLPDIADYYVLLLRPHSYELVPQIVGPAERKHWALLASTYHASKTWEAAK